MGSVLAGGEIVVEDYCGGYFIYELFVAASHTPEATVDHRTVGECRRESLVVTLHCHIWHLSMKML